jgi:uncharacterized protein YcbX
VEQARVTELHIFPVHGEPGQDLAEVAVEPEGLSGDRRKKAAVQVVAAEDVRPDTRANVIVDVPSAQLAELVGGVLRLGEVELDVTGTPHSCPGVYAAVRVPGMVRVGDMVTTGRAPE